MIIAAAVIIDGMVRALPAPARHHHILHKRPMPEHQHGDQGFIDDQQGFVSRRKAYAIAKSEGQLDGRVKTGAQNTPVLYSEDLW